MLDLAIPRAKGMVLAEMGAAGLGFAKSSTGVLDLAIPRAKGMALAETGAGFCQIKHWHARSGNTEGEGGGAGRIGGRAL